MFLNATWVEGHIRAGTMVSRESYMLKAPIAVLFEALFLFGRIVEKRLMLKTPIAVLFEVLFPFDGNTLKNILLCSLLCWKGKTC